MVFLLPELVLGIVGIAPPGAFKHPEHPLAAAFLRVFFNGAEQRFGRVPLQVTQDAREVVGLAADDEVSVVGHQAPGVNFQAFVVLAVAQAVHKNVIVEPPGEYVNPSDGRKADEIQLLRIADFVLLTHAAKIASS